MSTQSEQDSTNPRKRRKYLLSLDPDYEDPAKSKEYQEFQKRCPEEFKLYTKKSKAPDVKVDLTFPIAPKSEPSYLSHLFENHTEDLLPVEKKHLKSYQQYFNRVTNYEHTLNDQWKSTENKAVKPKRPKQQNKNPKKMLPNIQREFNTDDNNNDDESDSWIFSDVNPNITVQRDRKPQQKSTKTTTTESNISHDSLSHTEISDEIPVDALRSEDDNNQIIQLQNVNENIEQIDELESPEMPLVKEFDITLTPTSKKMSYISPSSMSVLNLGLEDNRLTSLKQASPSDVSLSPPLSSVFEAARNRRNALKNKNSARSSHIPVNCKSKYAKSKSEPPGRKIRTSKQSASKSIDENSPKSDSNDSQASKFSRKVCQKPGTNRTKKNGVLSNKNNRTNLIKPVLNEPKDNTGFQPSKLNLTPNKNKQKIRLSLDDLKPKAKADVLKETIKTVINEQNKLDYTHRETLNQTPVDVLQKGLSKIPVQKKVANPITKTAHAEEALITIKLSKGTREVIQYDEVSCSSILDSSAGIKERSFATEIPISLPVPSTSIEDNESSKSSEKNDISLRETEWEKFIQSAQKCPNYRKNLRPRKTNPYEIGFYNHGNTCYINATLQSILGLKDFVSAVEKWECTSNFDEDEASILADFQGICLSRQQNPYHVNETVRRLGENFCNHIYPAFKLGSQQDAGEFLNKIINQFEREEYNTTIVKKSFYFTYKDIFKCDKCGYQESAERNDLILLVPVREERCSIQELLFSQKGTCPKCREDAPYQFVFNKLPKYLILNLGRYKVTSIGSAAEKIDTPFEIQESVKVKCQQRDENDKNACNTDFSEATYNLTSIIIHKGSFLNSGHYTAKVCHEVNGQHTWYEYDDHYTCKTSLAEEDESDCYILLYTKEKSSPSKLEHDETKSDTESGSETGEQELSSTHVKDMDKEEASESVHQNSTEPLQNSQVEESVSITGVSKKMHASEGSENEKKSTLQFNQEGCDKDKQLGNNSFGEDKCEPKLDEEDKKSDTESQQTKKDLENIDTTELNMQSYKFSSQHESNGKPLNESNSKIENYVTNSHLFEDQFKKISDVSTREENNLKWSTTANDSNMFDFLSSSKLSKLDTNTSDSQLTMKDSDSTSDMEICESEMEEINSILNKAECEDQAMNVTNNFVFQSAPDHHTTLQAAGKESDMEVEVSENETDDSDKELNITVLEVKTIEKEDEQIYETWTAPTFDNSSEVGDLANKGSEQDDWYDAESAKSDVVKELQREESEIDDSEFMQAEEGEELDYSDLISEDDEN